MLKMDVSMKSFLWNGFFCYNANIRIDTWNIN